MLKKVLYVEDEKDIRLLATMALQHFGGLDLVVCENGFDVVNKAAEFIPDLLLLDVMMPGLDGPSTLQQLRLIPALADTPAVFMTAKVQPAEVQQLYEIGAIAVIHKPFEPLKLAGQLKSIYHDYHAGALK